MGGEEKEGPPVSEGPTAVEEAKVAPAAESEAPAAPPEPVEDWATRFKYLLAEFENFRRRTERDREVAHREATASFLRRLLPVYEAFLHARESVDRLPPEDALRQGLDLVRKEWDAIFQREGFTPVAIAGERFNSMMHEAVADAPATQERAEGTIVEIVQQGYRYHGGLLRPAKVTVARAPAKRSKGPPAPPADEPKTPEAPPRTEEKS